MNPTHRMLACSLLAPSLALLASGQDFGDERLLSNLSDTNSPWAVFAADLDGDGDADVLSASADDNRIAWYENLGSNTFGPQQVITDDALDADDVHAADLDGDGDADVLSASSKDDKIAWYENLGGAIFGAQQVISTDGNYPTAVDTSDLDGDGDLDVLAASANDGEIAWYENLGGGSFGPQQIINSSSDEAIDIYASDVDGDGDEDVLVADQWRIAWWENLGGGSFGPTNTIQNTDDVYTSIHAADLDGDGDNDALATSLWDGKVAWFENTDGAGNFSFEKTLTSSAEGPRSVFASDLDGDGDLDVLAASSFDDKIAWFKNKDGAGDFGPPKLISTDADLARSVYAADLDGDGDDDVLSASWRDDAITSYENLGGSFAAGQAINSPSNSLGSRSSFTVDLDDDGDEDVLAGSGHDGKVSWYENLGAGVFTPPHVISDTVDDLRCVHAADLDGDGDPDPIAASGTDDEIVWFENLGGGSFGSPSVITGLTDEPRSVYAADLDGDGDLEVLSASANDDTVAWYENLGGGSFGPQRVIATSNLYPMSVYASDLDDDGDADVLTAYWGNGDLVWFENTDGAGTFGPPQLIWGSASGASCVRAVDLDADNDLDVLAAAWGSHKILWFENLGGGTFGPEQVITNKATWARCAAWADLDGDNDPDVLSASQFNDTIAWYENQGGGVFGSQQIISDGAIGAMWVCTGDLDGDGDPDVVSASEDDDKMAWYENIMDGPGCEPAVFCDDNPDNVGDLTLSGCDCSAGAIDVIATGLGAFDGNAAYVLIGLGTGMASPTGVSDLCLTGATIGRYNKDVRIISGGGFSVDLLNSVTAGPEAPSHGGVSLCSGDTWRMQAWFRNGMNPSRFTRGISAAFH